MANMVSPADCLERAKMHDRLANATEDAQARRMHQAMAAEFRRRAADFMDGGMPVPMSAGPLVELVAAT